MAIEFNIRKATLEAHRYVGLPFPQLDLAGVVPDANSLGKAVLGKNTLGKPFFMDVEIDGVRLPNEPLVTITGKKVIVETVVVGSKRNGTVKEFIATGDYNIKIEGICIEPGVKEYPEKQVSEIQELVSKNETLEIRNYLAELFGINSLVIKDYGFGNMKGMPYSQSYYLSCVSDSDFYANLKDKPKAISL